MNNAELDYIKSCASLLATMNDHAQIIEILERLQTVSISIQTLKSTRIGIIVNKLTKRDDLPTHIQQFAWKLVNEWKEIATASAKEEQYIQQYKTQNSFIKPQNVPEPTPSIDTSSTAPNLSIRRRRKRPLSSMLDSEQTNTNTPSVLTSNSNSNTNSNHNKRQRTSTTNEESRSVQDSNSSMFAFGDKKPVPSLQQICIKVMKQNAMSIGKVPCELDGDLVKQIYGTLKPSELKKIYKLNPHLRIHLDKLWRRQLLNLNPAYVKKDDTMSWFKAYQYYLIERKDKLECAKRSLLNRTEQEKSDKQQARIFNKQEATAFKKRVNLMNRRNRMRFRSSSTGLSKRNRMMKDCMDFVSRRNRMFKTAAIKNSTQMGQSFNKKQSFIKRQKELRAQRQADKNRLLQW